MEMTKSASSGKESVFFCIMTSLTDSSMSHLCNLPDNNNDMLEVLT